MMPRSRDFDEIVDSYLSRKRFHHFEGDSGLDRLNTLASDLGYGESGFKYGSSLEQLLSDNPGAQAALVEWIRDQNNSDWRERLDDEEDQEDDEEGQCDECGNDSPLIDQYETVDGSRALCAGCAELLGVTD